jgi:hypothetical protein
MRRLVGRYTLSAFKEWWIRYGSVLRTTGGLDSSLHSSRIALVHYELDAAMVGHASGLDIAWLSRFP